MTEIYIEYLGDLRCRARHGPSGDLLLTDAPKDNEGQGRHFSPTDLVGAAMGTCMATIMGIFARRHAIDLAGMTLVVAKEMVADPHRRIGRLRVTFRLPRPLLPDQLTLLRKAAESCPVHRSLAPSTKVELAFETMTGPTSGL